MDIENVVELWETIKPFIGKTDRVACADALVAFLDENVLVDDLENRRDHLPSELYAAVISYYDLEEDSEEEENVYNY